MRKEQWEVNEVQKGSEMETEETIKARKDEAGVNETLVCGAPHRPVHTHTPRWMDPQRSVRARVCVCGGRK